MHEILTDIETYSEVDIKTCGLYRYASDPSFEILLISWAVDNGDGFGETQIADLASGDPFPPELLAAFNNPDYKLIAHNAAFERVCFSYWLQRQLGKKKGMVTENDFLSPDNWVCTMVMAASLTLPFALKDVAAVLKTVEQKDKEGERLIKLFSAPCKPTKSNGGRTRNLPEHLPADWAKFKSYCVQDVKTEVDIYNRLKRFPMEEAQRREPERRLRAAEANVDVMDAVFVRLRILESEKEYRDTYSFADQFCRKGLRLTEVKDHNGRRMSRYMANREKKKVVELIVEELKVRETARQNGKGKGV